MWNWAAVLCGVRDVNEEAGTTSDQKGALKCLTWQKWNMYGDSEKYKQSQFLDQNAPQAPIKDAALI